MLPPTARINRGIARTTAASASNVPIRQRWERRATLMRGGWPEGFVSVHVRACPSYTRLSLHSGHCTYNQGGLQGGPAAVDATARRMAAGEAAGSAGEYRRSYQISDPAMATGHLLLLCTYICTALHIQRAKSPRVGPPCPPVSCSSQSNGGGPGGVPLAMQRHPARPGDQAARTGGISLYDGRT